MDCTVVFLGGIVLHDDSTFIVWHVMALWKLHLWGHGVWYLMLIECKLRSLGGVLSHTRLQAITKLCRLSLTVLALTVTIKILAAGLPSNNLMD